MDCGYCENGISKDFFFCPHCGNELRKYDEIKAFGAAEEHKSENDQIKCKACDQFYDENFDYCPWCGSHYKEQPSEYSKTENVEDIGEF